MTYRFGAVDRYKREQLGIDGQTYPFQPQVLVLLALAAFGTAMADNDLITDFTADSPDLGWYVVNDNVMGGRSDGGFAVETGKLRFAGRTNTRGGGFSSIRTAELALDLSAHAGIRLRVRGDGRRYTWRLTTDARVYGRPIAYWADFDTADGDWQTVDVPFARFVPQFRGAKLDGPALDPSRITGMGLMIYDKLDGPFELQLASVHAYAASAPFSIDALRWQQRVLVVSAPSEDDERLETQRETIAGARAEFADRDLVLVTLVDAGTSSADERPLTAEEADGVRERLDIRQGSFTVLLIGKDGTKKLASNEPVAMAEIYALIDSMPMRRREMEER